MMNLHKIDRMTIVYEDGSIVVYVKDKLTGDLRAEVKR